MANLTAKAASLLRDMVQDFDGAKGSFSCSVYDTAWLSMVTKRVDEQDFWLFPTCFRYILDSQQPDGGWEPYASNFDGLLNTMAALLALSRHRDAPLQLGELMNLDIDARISRATIILGQRLMTWNVHEELHAAYELIVPALLRLLREAGFTFSFPGEQSLMELHSQKLSRFDLALLYQENQMTAVHPLEAFIGMVDFDRLKHQTRMGSMMGSPSSTAVYLQYSSVWDADAENYLRCVLSDGEGRGTGGVPNAFPTINFEMLWVVITLLHGGFTEDQLGCDQLSVVSKLLESSLQSGNGLLGFGPGLTPDADDTSHAITILRSLNRPAPIEQMIKYFEAKDHFRTYNFERNASFTVNCNVLKSLLSGEQYLGDNASQIEKVLRFLCDIWWSSDQRIKDKWNLSTHYSEMLLSQSVMRFLLLWDQGKISVFKGDTPFIQKILIMLFQVLTRVLQAQNVDGSWDNQQAEPTAYAILTMISLQPLPIVKSLQTQIELAINKGREFLVSPPSGRAADFVWIAKVTYYTENLRQAYTLAALNASPSRYIFEGRLRHTYHLPLESIAKFKEFYLRLPIFAAAPDWLVEASLLEGYLFLPQLREIQLDLFPRRKVIEDKFFEYVPFTWVVGNNLKKAHYRANLLQEMMIFTLLNKQADEYTENEFSNCFAGRSIEARQMINSLFDDVDLATNGHGVIQHNGTNSTTDASSGAPQVNGFSNNVLNPIDEKFSEQEIKVYETLRRFVQHLLCHPAVRVASKYDQSRLRQEMRHYLLAEVQQQLEDNANFAQHSQQDITIPYSDPNRTFFDWVRTTASDHSALPYSISFAICLISNGQDCFSTGAEKYLAQAAFRRLGILCRMYNDCGSLARDRSEKNLNCLNFPEFHDASGPEGDEALKERIMSLAAYERKCLELTVTELESVSQQGVVRFVRYFISVVDLYGQIYVVKDIANRVKKTAQ